MTDFSKINNELSAFFTNFIFRQNPIFNGFKSKHNFFFEKFSKFRQSETPSSQEVINSGLGTTPDSYQTASQSRNYQVRVLFFILSKSPKKKKKKFKIFKIRFGNLNSDFIFKKRYRGAFFSHFIFC